MATIRIPENVYPGFTLISILSDKQIDKIIDFLKSMSIGIKYDEVADYFDNIIGEQSGKELLKTILSFSEIADDDDDDYINIVDNLIKSFIDLSNTTFNVKEKKQLKKNLLSIFKNYDSINKTIKSKQLAFENENNLSGFKLFTDMRLVFDKDLKSKERIGIVIHKLKLEYLKNVEENEIHLSLDIKDLKKLKIEIEKAIEKDQLIREDYKEVLKYIL